MRVSSYVYDVLVFVYFCIASRNAVTVTSAGGTVFVFARTKLFLLCHLFFNIIEDASFSIAMWVHRYEASFVQPADCSSITCILYEVWSRAEK